MANRKLIGVFATGIYSRLQSNLYMALHEQAKRRGYNLVLFSGSYDKNNITQTASVSPILYELAENIDLCAMIIHAQSIGDAQMIENIISIGKKKNIPIFIYDCEEFDIAPHKNLYIMNLNYEQGFADSIKHIIEHHGCKRIYMLAGIKNNKYSDVRENIYRKEMQAHGLKFEEDWIGYGGFWERPATEAVNKFMSLASDVPEAICCANDVMAITAIKVLKKKGIRVPEDVLVTGFDGIEEGKFNLPSISTCEPKLDEAVLYIFRVLGKSREEHEYKIPLVFYPKESCDCEFDDNLKDRETIVRFIEGIRHDSWQNHMLTRMYVGLTDSCDLSNGIEYMEGVLGLFDGYSHFIGIRDDIEYTTDYENEFDRLRIFLDRGFLWKPCNEGFNKSDVVPYKNLVFDNAKNDDIFIFKLIHNMNKVYGYAVVRTDKYVTNEIRLLDEFLDGATNVIENIIRNRRLKIANEKLSSMYERISEMYIRDALTGLYNRNGFDQMLSEYMNREDLQNGYVHLLSVDMDSMKSINDGYGHAEGDIAIKAVAKALEDCFAQPCICARYGGDEFAVALFSDKKDEPSVSKLDKKINNYIDKLPMLLEKEYKVRVSIGQAVEKVSAKVDFEALSRMADRNMYVNKKKRNGDVR